MVAVSPRVFGAACRAAHQAGASWFQVYLAPPTPHPRRPESRRRVARRARRLRPALVEKLVPKRCSGRASRHRTFLRHLWATDGWVSWPRDSAPAVYYASSSTSRRGSPGAAPAPWDRRYPRQRSAAGQGTRQFRVDAKGKTDMSASLRVGGGRRSGARRRERDRGVDRARCGRTRTATSIQAAVWLDCRRARDENGAGVTTREFRPASETHIAGQAVRKTSAGNAPGVSPKSSGRTRCVGWRRATSTGTRSSRLSWRRDRRL